MKRPATKEQHSIAYQQAAESLVHDQDLLAVVSLSETQMALGMPKHVIVLAGLAGGDANLFRRLQTVHPEKHAIANNNNNNNKMHNYYHLSPSMLPNPETAERIQAACAERQQVLAAQAEHAARQLLVVEQQEQQEESLKPSSAPVMRRRVLASDNDDDDNVSESDSSDTEHVPLQDHHPQHGGNVLLLQQQHDDDDETERWTRVTKNKRTTIIPKEPINKQQQQQQAKASSKEIEAGPGDAEPVEQQPRNTVDVEATAVSTEGVHDTLTPEIGNPGVVETFENRVMSSPEEEDKTSMHEDIDRSSQEIERLQDRVQQLEEQLAATKQILEQERTTNSTGMQALQLRLYISETRLKTFEDALEHHVATVNNNCALSPERRSDLQDSGGGGMSPLYSRVLRKKVT